MQKQKHYKHYSTILVEFTLKMIILFGENGQVKSKIRIPNSKKKKQKSNANLKQPLRGLFFAVLTPVQIYVVVLQPVRFFSFKRAFDGAGAF